MMDLRAFVAGILGGESTGGLERMDEAPRIQVTPGRRGTRHTPVLKGRGVAVATARTMG